MIGLTFVMSFLMCCEDFSHCLPSTPTHLKRKSNASQTQSNCKSNAPESCNLVPHAYFFTRDRGKKAKLSSLSQNGAGFQGRSCDVGKSLSN